MTTLNRTNKRLCVFFDTEKAFDKTKPTSILKALDELEIKGRLKKYVNALLQEQTFQVRINDIHSAVKKQKVGTS